MTEEEAADSVRLLQLQLAELGAALLGTNARSVAINDFHEVSSRQELALLLDELEAVLVDAPKMIELTLETLGASRLTFSADDLPSGAVAASPITDGDVSITSDSLGVALQNAETASGILSELRRRLND